MARIGRLAGALLVETVVGEEAAWFLVGDTKVPCDWSAAGFAPPEERDVKRDHFVRLEVCGAPALTGTTLSVALEGEDAARAIASRLIIVRNGSVSERLWRLIVGEEVVAGAATERAISAAWLCEMPLPVWNVVRDAVLKCT